MGKPGLTLSNVPNDHNQTIYLVMDIYKSGPVWHQTGLGRTDLEAVIISILEGQYQNPVRVVGFNTAEKWSEDVSADVAHELRRRCSLQLHDVPFYLKEFVERYEGSYHDVQLPDPLGVSRGIPKQEARGARAFAANLSFRLRRRKPSMGS
jgi:hypothetical protein